MRPDLSKAACSVRAGAYTTHNPGALGTKAEVGGEEVGCVNLRALGHRDEG